ncbi:hypothetical protein BDV93DRAFT_301289 [Ceratobasidium sp. AG-I]|nr:hypothetical protein BDV93DRAFT_301289 [Ceratobasidium sp. AG-I]
MNPALAPKAIAIVLRQAWFIDIHEGYAKIMSRARTQCLVHDCPLPNISRSPFRRIFGYGQPYESQVQAAYQFVVDNYRSGDSVMLFGWMPESEQVNPRYIAIQQLAKALDNGSLSDPSESNMGSGGIPIKSVCIYFRSRENLSWSEFDQVLSDFPFTVENILCSSSYDAYVIQRGMNGQIRRKEMWTSDRGFFRGQVN